MEKLELKETDKEGIRIGIRSNGVKYTVRDDRSRYFFPDEWRLFLDNVRQNKQAIFDTLIQTGGRIDEILHIRPKDFDFDRNILILRTTKTRAKKGERVGKPRTIPISLQYARRIRKYIKNNKINDESFIFSVTSQAVSQLFKRRMEASGIKDWYQFSLHNIRKTTGNWLRALEVSAEEICLRLGHDMNTYLKHYGSPSVFDRRDKQMMIRTMGDLY